LLAAFAPILIASSDRAGWLFRRASTGYCDPAARDGSHHDATDSITDSLPYLARENAPGQEIGRFPVQARRGNRLSTDRGAMVKNP
jgi:hypothetical protein